MTLLWKLSDKKGEKMNVYYVIDTEPRIQPDGFYQKSLGTHTDRSEILRTQKILYEGTNAKKANAVFRKANSGRGRFDGIAVIYKGELGRNGPVVLHKV